MANNFINFLIANDTQTAIGNYGVDKYGKALFIPMSVSVPQRSPPGNMSVSTDSPRQPLLPPAATAAPVAAATTA